MFKLEPNPTFFAPVELHIPGQGKGRFEAEYRYLDKAARDAYYDALGEKTNLEALSEVIVGWREIDTPFSREALERLLNAYAGAAAALFETFARELSGAAVKN